MTDADQFDEPPDDNEAFESLDESLDDEDVLRPGGGSGGSPRPGDRPSGGRDGARGGGATLDDPEQMSMLDGGIDDPDGADPPARDDTDAGWDLDAEDEESEAEDDDSDLLE